MFLYTCKNGYESGSALARALGISIIRTENSRFKGAPDKTVINWGVSDLPVEVRKCNVINPEKAVMLAVNKLWAFRNFPQEICVTWTTDPIQAQQWLLEGSSVAVRGRLKGFDGDGLTLIDPGQRLPEARLYTKVIPIQKEYRITVYGDRVLGRQRKVPLDGVANPNQRVRTSGGGWGFKWVTLNIPEQVERYAIRAIGALGLDFGGVDVVWDGTRAWVLEVNTAPHLTPIMISRMAAALREFHE